MAWAMGASACAIFVACGGSDGGATSTDAGSVDASGSEAGSGADASSDSASDAAPGDAPAEAAARAPGAPTAVTASANVTKGIRLAWTAPTDSGSGAITSYTVTASPTVPASQIAYAKTAALVTGLSVGQMYTFTVHATNGAGSGPESAATPTVTVVDGPAPPTALAACAGNQRIKLAATDASSFASYTLYEAPTTGVTKLSGTAISITGFSYADTGLVNGTKRYYVAATVSSTGVESLDSTEVFATPDSVLHDVTAAHSYSTTFDSIEVTDCFSQVAHSTLSTTRLITGAATTITSSGYNQIAIDPQRALIYFHNPSSILVFGNAGLATGNTAPIHTITGTINGSGMAVDASRDVLYVVMGATVGIWTNASSLTGAVAPNTTLTSSSVLAPHTIVVDETNNRLYMSDSVGFAGKILEWDNASTLSGDVAPTRNFHLAGGINAWGAAIDASRDILYVSDRTAGDVYSFDGASTLNGLVTASRVVTGLTNPMGIAVGADRLLEIMDGDAFLAMWSGAHALNGATAADKSLVFYGINSSSGLAYAP
jgi:hypothetical protein